MQLVTYITFFTETRFWCFIGVWIIYGLASFSQGNNFHFFFVMLLMTPLIVLILFGAHFLYIRVISIRYYAISGKMYHDFLKYSINVEFLVTF